MTGFAIPASDADGAACAQALARADWSDFDADRDLPGLRELLRGLEQREGVTEAHRLATAVLRRRGARLRHHFGHELAVTAHALSPDRRYLAVSNPPDFFATEEGTLQVWEVASGRCVNTFRAPEGLGWDGYGDCVQWSGDSHRLVLNFCTSLIGRWDPFAAEPRLEADVSAAAVTGASRPVAFAALPDAETVFVATADWKVSAETGVRGGLAPVAEHYYEADYGEKELRASRPLSAPAPSAREVLAGGYVDPDAMTVAADGRWLWGIGILVTDEHDGPPRGAAFGVDVTVPRLEWVRRVDFSAGNNPLCIAQHTDRLACHTDTSVLILDPHDGTRLAEYPALPPESSPAWQGSGASRLAWDPTGTRLAEFTSVAVRIHRETGAAHEVAVTLPESAVLDQRDLFPFAWAPDRPHFALLTAESTIEIWDATAEPRLSRRIEVPEGLIGLFWGAGDVLVAAGGDRLHFVGVDGRVVSDIPSARTPGGEDDEDDEEVDDEADFVLADGTEVFVLPDDVVIAPPQRAAELDAALVWSVERRYGWPLRWGMPEVFADFETVREHRGVDAG